MDTFIKRSRNKRQIHVISDITYKENHLNLGQVAEKVHKNMRGLKLIAYEL